MKPDRDQVKDACAKTRALAHSIVLRRVVAAFQEPVLEHARRRIADGQLGYDDLLVLTRRLLTEHAGVRNELRRRYQRMFVDEFQDTDRVQFEIIRLLTDPDDGRRRPAGRPGCSRSATQAVDLRIPSGGGRAVRRAGRGCSGRRVGRPS